MKPTFTAVAIELRLKQASYVGASIAWRPTHPRALWNGLTEVPRLCAPDAASTPSLVPLRESLFLKNFSRS